MAALALNSNAQWMIDINKIFEQPGVLNTQAKEPDAMQEWIIVSTALDAAIIDLAATKSEWEGLFAELFQFARLQKHREAVDWTNSIKRLSKDSIND